MNNTVILQYAPCFRQFIELFPNHEPHLLVSYNLLSLCALSEFLLAVLKIGRIICCIVTEILHKKTHLLQMKRCTQERRHHWFVNLRACWAIFPRSWMASVAFSWCNVRTVFKVCFSVCERLMQPCNWGHLPVSVLVPRNTCIQKDFVVCSLVI